MKTLVGLTTLAVLLLVSTVMGQVGYPALGEVSYDYFGSGARAFAMGNANIGLADDVNGGTWNPAGIWSLSKPVMSASYMSFDPHGHFTQSMTPVATNNSLNSNGLGNFSFATPFWVKGHSWVFNFNFKRNNNFITEAKYYSGVENLIIPDNSTTDKGYLRTYSFGLGTQVYGPLSFGFLANIFDGRRVTENTGQYAVDVVVTEIPPDIRRVYSERQSIDSTTSNGLNFTMGLMYRMEKVKVGAVVYTPFEMKNSTDHSLFNTSTTNGLPDITNSDTVFVNDSIAKQDIPLTLGFGIAVMPTEKLNVTADLVYQNYGSVNWFFRDSTFFSAAGDRTDYFSKIPIDWNNTIGIGAGVEYMLNTGLGTIPIRAGVRFDQLPQPKDFMVSSNTVLDNQGEATDSAVTTYTASGRQNTIGLSLGTGVQWSQIHFDFAYRFTDGAETNLTQFFDGEQFATQKIERKAHEFKVTFTGFFE